MEITLNGKRLSLDGPITVAALLDAQALSERRVAVEINGEILPRSRHGAHQLCDKDRIEIVHALGGG